MLPIDRVHRYDGQESDLTCINETVTIPGPAGRLEGVTACPPEGETRGVVAIICHPHPLYGGSFQNKVVHYLSRTCNELGVPSLRFNFRGVGNSDGVYDHGMGETDDLLAVIDWVNTRRPGFGIWLAGFSFGAFVAYRAANRRPQVQRLITVAPPVNLFNFGGIEPPGCPWLVIQGRQDEIVPCAEVERWVRSQAQSPQLVCLSAADHFFHGQLNILRSELAAVLGAIPAAYPAQSCQ